MSLIRTIRFVGDDADAAGVGQGYRGVPTWWKMYASQIERLQALDMTDAERWHVIALWQLATEMGNTIPDSAEWLAHRLGLSEPIDLDRLEDLGLIGPVGKTPRARAHDARPRGEKEEEKKKKKEKEISFSARPRVTRAHASRSNAEQEGVAAPLSEVSGARLSELARSKTLEALEKRKAEAAREASRALRESGELSADDLKEIAKMRALIEQKKAERDAERGLTDGC